MPSFPLFIERNGPPFLIAEIGVNHNGSLATARSLIHAAKDAGADAVKFQLFQAKLLLAHTAGLVAYQESAASTAEDLLAPLELTVAQMTELVTESHRCNLAAIITPFSVDLAAAAASTGCDALKIASPDCVNRPLLDAAAATGLPLIVSTGGATLDEVLTAALWLNDAADHLAFLQCVSSYPTAPENASLGGITALRQALPDLPIGYSDHTTSVWTGALAVAAGASILEKHLTLNRAAPGPDHAASLEPSDFAAYAREARLAHLMRGPIEKSPRPVESTVHHQTRQSVIAVRALRAGETIQSTDLAIKRPGTGIPAAQLTAVIGRKLARNVAANHVLTWDDLAGATS